MQITIGCSLDEYRRRPEWADFPLINIENPLYPGYLNGDWPADAAFLAGQVRSRKILDGPYIDLNLGSPEPQARRLAVEKTRQALAFARRAGAEEIVFLSTFLPLIGLESYERGWIEQSLRSWEEILAEDPGVRISLCNTFEYEPSNLVEIVERLRRPDFGLAFDVGHCLVWGQIDPLVWLERIRPYARVIYLHSNDGRADQHVSIRTGRLAEGSRLAELGQAVQPADVVILKYFDPQPLTDDLAYLHTLWAA